MSAINNLFVGENNADAYYIGSEEVEVIYLGGEVVYQKGEFVGITMKSSVALGVESGNSYNLKIRSSEPWTLNVDTAVTWLDFSQMTGDTGETVVVVSTNEENQTGNDRTTTITAITANYSATCVVTQYYVDFVDYISTSALTSGPTNTRIDTGIIPTTATTFRIQGMYKGHSQGSVIVGYSYNDSRDYRVFWAGGDARPDMYYDFNFDRLGSFSNILEPEKLVDITCNNYSITFNGSVLGTGTTKTTIDDPHSILVDVGSWWVKSLEIWEGNTKVFDGHAGKIGNTVGLYDSITRQIITNPNLNIVEHYMYFELFSLYAPPSPEYISTGEGTFYKEDPSVTSYEMGLNEKVYLVRVGAMPNTEICILKDETDGSDFYHLCTTNSTSIVLKRTLDGEPIATIDSGNVYSSNGLTINNYLGSSTKEIVLTTNNTTDWSFGSLKTK